MFSGTGQEVIRMTCGRAFAEISSYIVLGI